MMYRMTITQRNRRIETLVSKQFKVLCFSLQCIFVRLIELIDDISAGESYFMTKHSVSTEMDPLDNAALRILRHSFVLLPRRCLLALLLVLFTIFASYRSSTSSSSSPTRSLAFSDLSRFFRRGRATNYMDGAIK